MIRPRGRCRRGNKSHRGKSSRHKGHKGRSSPRSGPSNRGGIGMRGKREHKSDRGQRKHSPGRLESSGSLSLFPKSHKTPKSCKSCKSKKSVKSNGHRKKNSHFHSEGEIRKLTSIAELKDLLDSAGDSLVLVAFYNPSSKEQQSEIEPIMFRTQKYHKKTVIVRRVDCEKDRDLANLYANHYPTIVIFKDKKPIAKFKDPDKGKVRQKIHDELGTNYCE